MRGIFIAFERIYIRGNKRIINENGEMMITNWWEIGDNQNLWVNPKEFDVLVSIILNKYGSLSMFAEKLMIPRSTFYNKLKYKNQGITVSLLKRILCELNIPFQEMCKFPINIGKYKLVKAKFPIEIKPSLGQVFANSLFDGYADRYIMRYSNYDPEIREEFCRGVINFIKGVNIPINIPKNFERDIDLPTFVPQLLQSILSVDTFLGDKCRIPKPFFEIVKKEENFGWYFLKGAYLDEGTISSNEILILTGIKNKPLVEDAQKIAKILGLLTKIRSKRSRPGYYELKLSAISTEKFYENVSNLFFTQVAKWDSVGEIIGKRKVVEERKKRIKEECENILKACKEKGKLTFSEIRQNCKLPESTLYFRLQLLVYNGNLYKKRNGKRSEYIFKSNKLSPLPTINIMRRRFGWR